MLGRRHLAAAAGIGAGRAKLVGTQRPRQVGRVIRMRVRPRFDSCSCPPRHVRVLRPIRHGRCRVGGRRRQVARRRHDQRRALAVVDVTAAARYADDLQQPVIERSARALHIVVAGAGDGRGGADETRCQCGSGYGKRQRTPMRRPATVVALQLMLRHTLTLRCRFGTLPQGLPPLKNYPTVYRLYTRSGRFCGATVQQ